MGTRRDLLSAVAGLGALPACGFPKPASAAGRLRTAVPAGACDTHAPVLDPALSPYSANRRYTPGAATVPALAELLDRLGLERAVVVQNSVYGADNRAVVDAVQQLGQ